MNVCYLAASKFAWRGMCVWFVGGAGDGTGSRSVLGFQTQESFFLQRFLGILEFFFVSAFAISRAPPPGFGALRSDAKFSEPLLTFSLQVCGKLRRDVKVYLRLECGRGERFVDVSRRGLSLMFVPRGGVVLERSDGCFARATICDAVRLQWIPRETNDCTSTREGLAFRRVSTRISKGNGSGSAAAHGG